MSPHLFDAPLSKRAEQSPSKRGSIFDPFGVLSIFGSLTITENPLGTNEPSTTFIAPEHISHITNSTTAEPSVTTKATSSAEKSAPPVIVSTATSKSSPARTPTPTPTIVRITAEIPSISVSISTQQAPTVTVSAETTMSATPDRQPPSFFQRKGVVAGVFTTLGCVVIILILIIVFFIRRHRRAKTSQRDITPFSGSESGNVDIRTVNIQEELWSIGCESSLSQQPESPIIWDSNSQTSLLPNSSYSGHTSDTFSINTHITRYPSPPPAYGDLSRRPTMSALHESSTR
ncbi:hypothetical protein BDZ94DRAFT_1313115 [Collybia nuda]|uniref:Uncharacterized protein n=1 Tax=Collybia nuda TaxID=64659 RepID=A0A9P6CAR0_9AGAR|nr:hypothetical protein BDZ94DRAFT_1313115 [Collybia nuda]